MCVSKERHNKRSATAVDLGLRSEDEWNHVAEMERVARGTTTRVKEERLALFVQIEDAVEFAGVQTDSEEASQSSAEVYTPM